VHVHTKACACAYARAYMLFSSWVGCASGKGLRFNSLFHFVAIMNPSWKGRARICLLSLWLRFTRPLTPNSTQWTWWWAFANNRCAIGLINFYFENINALYHIQNPKPICSNRHEDEQLLEGDARTSVLCSAGICTNAGRCSYQESFKYECSAFFFICAATEYINGATLPSYL
jgi:hypothetical protein